MRNQNQNKHSKYLLNCCMPQNSTISQLKLKTLTHWMNEEYYGYHGNQAIAIAYKRRHNFEKYHANISVRF